MEVDRLQEIVQSPAMININYHGIPVYIQEVDDKNETARVFPLDEMDHEQFVDLNGLTEEGPSI
ncbi:H-type small acid-soluble spore protein [Oceanobacillus halotolerans]|uniref:H-type small acid-soluble spore protein n=1 Tax=Oceanobacillus halotolerans TaxID=2663380 RepID=UPI0013D41125|nr:H-type small acid-soluble spore protein [Oceanobacillus halotolerans]